MEGNNNFSQNYDFQTVEWKLKGDKDSRECPNVHLQCLKYVINNSKENDAESVIKVFDQFCSKNWMMNVGPVKGAIINQEIKKRNPKKILEVGGYCGYSALMMALSSPQNVKVYTIQISQEYANIAKKIHKHAGMQDKIHIQLGVVQKCEQFIKKTGPFDFILLDHHKKYYLSDLKLLEKFGAIKTGTVIAGDNIICPGAPDYLAYFKNDAINRYKSILYHSYIEYSQDTKDAVLISEKL